MNGLLPPAATARHRLFQGLLVTISVVLLSACGTQPVQVAGPDDDPVETAARPAAPVVMVPAPQGGGYYKDDGPHAMIPSNLDHVPDAVPRIEVLYQPSLRPYRVLGQRFVPMTTLEPYTERGHASWYGRKFHGKLTATGERYDMYAMTAAHPTLPLPSYVRVTNVENQRSVVVRVNDRGPFLKSRVIDLSYAAAHRLGYINAGSALVDIEVVMPEDAAVREAVVEPMDEPSNATAAADDVGVGRDVKLVYVASATPESDPPLAFESAPSAVAPVAAARSEAVAAAAPTARAPYLQLGAFKTPSNAAKLMVRVRDELEIESERMHLLDGDGRYRLQIGPFTSISEARNAAGRIALILDLEPYVLLR